MTRSRRLVMAWVLAGLIASCVGPLHPSLELRELQADPAARIRMQGADELLHFELERGNTVEGPNFAFDSYLFGTQVTMEEILAFYDVELGRLGWTRDDFAVTRSTTELRSWGWCKPRKTFRLAIERPGSHSYSPDVFKGRTYRTVFDAGLVAVEEKAKCGK